MPANVTNIAHFSSLLTSRLAEPAFKTNSVFWHGNLQNTTSPLGGEFEKRYRDHLTSATARSTTQLGLATRFPSRLFGPDDGTFKTGDSCPEYAVISYTWGRWKRPTRELDWPVNGAYWMVPANDLFSREEFTKAIRNICKGLNVWVDVLCIPQNETDPEMAIEIGKQGDIFRSASYAAVWLSSGGEEDLVEICSAVPEETFMIPPDALALRHPENIGEARRRLRLVARLPGSVPWTTSLWTLQEAALRPDSVFHGKSGNPLYHRASGNPITIRHLSRTMSQIHDLLEILFTPHNDAPQGVLDKPQRWGMCEEDIHLVFQALDAVNRISLHKLSNMNASELLLACTHRVSERAHDRVYGIMGAIGVTVPVDYKADADEIMSAFMVELHNRVPAEMQAFFRPAIASAGGKQWAVDEDVSLLTLVRQLHAPERKAFLEVASNGYLVVGEVVHVSKSGLEELTTRALSEFLLPALDTGSFSHMADGVMPVSGIIDKQGELPYVKWCLLLKDIYSKHHIALVFLGSIAGMDELGWRYMYLLVGSKETPTATPERFPYVFQRLGVLILGHELTADKPTSGRFFIS